MSTSEPSMAETMPLGGDDEGVRRQVAADMDRYLKGSDLGPRAKLALACRYLADAGHARTLAGQVSVRTEDGTFWTNGFATGLAETRASNLVRIDSDLEVLEGATMPNPAIRFHMWIYAKRPDVSAIVHTHPPHASALAWAGQALEVAHMDMMMFYEDCAFLTDWPGVPVANEEGRLISEAIGDRHSILLANHGLLTAGESIEHAVYLAASLENAAEVQLLAAAAGLAPKPVDRQRALEARSFMTAPRFVEAMFGYWARLTAARHPEALE